MRSRQHKCSQPTVPRAPPGSALNGRHKRRLTDWAAPAKSSSARVSVSTRPSRARADDVDRRPIANRRLTLSRCGRVRAPGPDAAGADAEISGGGHVAPAAASVACGALIAARGWSCGPPFPNGRVHALETPDDPAPVAKSALQHIRPHRLQSGLRAYLSAAEFTEWAASGQRRVHRTGGTPPIELVHSKSGTEDDHNGSQAQHALGEDHAPGAHGALSPERQSCAPAGASTGLTVALGAIRALIQPENRN